MEVLGIDCAATEEPPPPPPPPGEDNGGGGGILNRPKPSKSPSIACDRLCLWVLGLNGVDAGVEVVAVGVGLWGILR